MSVFILVRYLPFLFYLSFDRFGDMVYEINEPNWGSMEDGVNCLN